MTASLKILLLPLATLMSCLLPAPSLLAAEGNVSPALTVGSAELLNVGGGLIVVVLAIIVLGIVYARTQGINASSGGVINIIASQAIGPKERIAIVEIAEKQLLIGVTPTNVQMLHVLDNRVSVTPTSGGGFSDRLKAFMHGQGK